MPRKRRPVFDLRQRRIIRDTARKVFEEKFKGKESPQRKMALALGLSQTTISALLAGTYVPSVQVADDLATLAGYESIKDLVGPYYQHTAEENAPPSSGTSLSSHAYPNLTKCIEFYGKEHWPAFVIAAAKAGYYAEDVAPKEWPERLDSLEKLLKSRG
jgi:DNA-binding XRE family transcriptional regulator